MPEKVTKPEETKEEAPKPKKEPTIQEMRKAVLSDLEFHAATADKFKRMKDAGLLDNTTEREMKETMDQGVRQILGMAPKPAMPVYTPPAPAAAPPIQYPAVPVQPAIPPPRY